jgi:hypothetical protein
MSEYLEHDPKRIESLRMQIDSLIQNYLNQKPIPGIADFAEVFGAESYVVEMKRQKAIKIDIKSFREEMVTRLLEQSKSSGTDVVLPKVFEMLSQTILPPDEGEIKAGSGEGVEKKKYIPRTQYLIELLSEMGEQYEIMGGKNTSDMMRERTYFIFFLPNSEKALFVNNEEGNTTFIIYQVNSKQEAIDLAAFTKDEIRAQELHSHPYVQIDWTGDGESWKGKVFEYLTGPVPGNGKNEEILTNVLNEQVSGEKKVEYVPEGWNTLYGISKEIGQSREWVQSRIDELLPKYIEWKPEVFISVGGQKSLHYPPELIVELKRQGETIDHAPDGWLSVKEIEKALKKDYSWVLPRVKKILIANPTWLPKKFAHSKKNTTYLFYPPELIVELKRQAEAIGPAPDGWLPLKEIENIVGKSEAWLTSRIERLITKHPQWEAEVFLSQTHKELFHYPPQLINALKIEAEVLERAPEGWLTLTGIENVSGKSASWIKKRVKEIAKANPTWGIKDYLDAGGHKLPHYAPEFITELNRQAEMYKEAPEGWVTFGTIPVEIGKSKLWIRPRVNKLVLNHPEWAAKNFLDKTGKIAEHYSPDLMIELKKLAEKDVIAPEGWKQIKLMAKVLSRDKDWITVRVPGIISAHPEWAPKEYLNNSGQLGLHYPEEVFFELKKISENENSK